MGILRTGSRKILHARATFFLPACVALSCLVGCDVLRPHFGKVEVVARAKGFFEGPAFDEKSGCLFFVDVGDRQGRVWKIDAQGKKTVYVKTGSPANSSSLIGPDGALYIAQNSTKKILRVGRDGKVTTVVKDYAPAKMPGPNDIAFRRDGAFYFTCPDWSGRKDPRIGSVFFVSKDGRTREVAKGLAQPNGIGLSPDEKTLYVALTGQDKLVCYRVLPDGNLSGERTFVQFSKPAGPDGMVVDKDGTVYQTLHMTGEVVAINPAGRILARLKVNRPRGITNCTLSDGRLYITLVSKSDKDAAVLRVRIHRAN